MNNGKKNTLLEAAYQDATFGKPYSYLFLDLDQNQHDDMRLRSSVFPDKDCVVYMSK